MKFRVVDNIVHKRQQKGYSCGAAATAMLLGVDESIVRPLVKCNASGTSMADIHEFLDSGVARSHLVNIQQSYYETLFNRAVALVELEKAAGIWDVDF